MKELPLIVIPDEAVRALFISNEIDPLHAIGYHQDLSAYNSIEGGETRILNFINTIRILIASQVGISKNGLPEVTRESLSGDDRYSEICRSVAASALFHIQHTGSVEDKISQFQQNIVRIMQIAHTAEKTLHNTRRV